MKDKKIQTAILIVIFLLLILPMTLKTGFTEKTFTSEETYLNLIQVNQIQQEPLHKQITNNNPFHVLLKKIPLNDVGIAFIIPLITGILTIILIFIILRKLNLSDNEIVLALLLFSLTPIFLYKFTTLNPDNLAFPLLLLTIILYMKKTYTTSIPLILMTFINPILGIIFTIFLITELLLKKQNKTIKLTLLISIISLAIYFLTLDLFINIQRTILDNVLIELGSMNGYSIPLIILSAIGLFAWWEKGKERTIITTSLTTGLIISLFIPEIRLIFALALAIFAGIGMNQLLTMEWELKKIKQIAILLIFYIILFSAIITINTQLTQISKQEVEASKFLASIKTENQVLSTENKGFMIQYLSQKQTFLDGNTQKNKQNEKIDIANQIFYARKLSELQQLLNENNIEYIFIHEKMKNGGTWIGREEGLQFFLQHSEQFIKIFDNEQVQIYKYIEKQE